MKTYKQFIAEQEINKITIDVPTFIRMLEWAREDVKDDVVLHVATEKILKLHQQNVAVITMNDYDKIIN